MYVFRDGRKAHPGEQLVRAALDAIQELRPENSDSILSALVSAGELECALEDAGSEAASAARELTDGVAVMLAGGRANPDGLANLLKGMRPPRELRISVLEGFAYYALHPRKYLQLISTMELPERVAVIGIRSIGAPLSAVVRGALAASGRVAERITVRPGGHPYDRQLEPEPGLERFLERNRGAKFLIVDEGPGLSGSSFLAVAEWLAGSGVPEDDIVMIGSRAAPDPNCLRTKNAVTRWPRFAFRWVQPEAITPPDAEIAIGGGLWRRHFLIHNGADTPCWTQLDVPKYVSRDNRFVFRFEGFGHFGKAIGARSRRLAELGLSPQYGGNFEGFGRYRIVEGRSLSGSDLSQGVLRHMAEYCALRVREFPHRVDGSSELEHMLRCNWRTEFGTELDEQLASLDVVSPVVSDSRMHPGKWLQTPTGLLKVAAASHGDGHFFPGPCDIAWDLAGAIVEWELHPDAQELFLSHYRSLTDDDAGPRLRSYLLAYSAFRIGWCKMAAAASPGSYDERLLLREARRYRLWAERFAHTPWAESGPLVAA